MTMSEDGVEYTDVGRGEEYLPEMEVERLSMEEIPYWIEELRDEVKHNISQFQELTELHERLGIILKDIEKPLGISMENQRTLNIHKGSEVGQDIVDQALLKEIEALRRRRNFVTKELGRVHLHLAQIPEVRLEIEAAVDKISKAKDRDDCVRVLSALSKEIGTLEDSDPNELSYLPMSYLQHLQSVLEKSQLERNMAQFMSTDVTRSMLEVANECFGVWYSTNAAIKARIVTKTDAKTLAEHNVQKLDQDIQTLQSHIQEVQNALSSKTSLLQQAQAGLDSRKGEQAGLELCRDLEMMSLLREMQVHRNGIELLTKKIGDLESTLDHLFKTKRTLGRDLKLKCIGIRDQEKCLRIRQTFPISTFQEARTAKPFSAYTENK